MAIADGTDIKKDLSREEDYRDFEQRDIENGWPYDDGAGAASRPVSNGAYGESGANFDRDRNGGYRVTNVDADGGQAPLVSPVLPETDHRENSDQLEANVAAALEDLPDLLLNALDIHADGRVVTLRGAVDTAEERRMIELRVVAVSGVSAVRNMITTMGVDTHIPGDAD
ncbi:MAG: BON domain-containing protein [Alphaproteobacteria bacterium]|nr:BON domain-containing protein [Rhizobiaceae bacterium]MBU3959371.1 BON domain-containing protein [Alphaproteobacteria bacterium]MBU4049488.1 BON domain-containing protein [Alphaproteobacteria bacterium]MBU4089714.1 BON domain-containing protein [Alphaproteobacteria bacterium]MBU4154795.1 BON domain-containing protein [Alphaproteobacteria bacterium]